MSHETDREDPKQVRPTQHASTQPGQKGGKGKTDGMRDDLDEARGVADQKKKGEFEFEESDSDSSTSSRSGKSGSEPSTGKSGKGEEERGANRSGGGSSPSGGSGHRPNQR